MSLEKQYQKQVLIVEPEEDGERIDKYLAKEFDDCSRSFIQKLVREEAVCVNEIPVKSNYKVRGGDVLSVVMKEPEQLAIEAEPIPLEIVYEDSDVIVVNKPKGMVVHPAPGHHTGTLVNALMYHCKDQLSGINGVLRPGIVHRIDRDTTGILVACKNDFAHKALAEQLAVHSITRKYNAICYNRFGEPSGTVDAPIGRHKVNRKKMCIDKEHGRRAVTHYRVLENFERYAHIECTLETGRTHQIRVHMSSIGHPLLGDAVYCNAVSPYHLQGQTLHARLLGFVHPRSGKYMEFEAPLPEYFQKLCHIL